ncbi:hypothetical protein Tco_0778769 [Tanacetum coccineum]
MSTLTFSDTHNMIAFLDKPAESDGFHEIIDFLNDNQIYYALTVNPTIYTSCIEQFWATAKAKTVNGERQLQALVDKKKVIITETSIRSDLHLEDAGGTDCLPTATIFEELARMGYEKPSQKLTFYKAFFSPQWKFLIHTITQCLSAKTTAWNEFSSTMASAIICLATNQKFNLSKYIFDAMLGDMSHHKKIYVNPSHTKKIFANMKREGKDFSGRKKQSMRKQKKTTAVPHPSDSTADVPNEEFVPTHSNDPLLSGEDRLKLTDLMDMCTKLSERVLDLEHTKTAQAQEITNLKLRVKKLEKKAGLRTHKFKRLYKVGVTRRVEYSDDESLGAQKDAFNQGRSIEDIDKDAEVSLVDEIQGRSDDAKMFYTDALIGNEVFAENDIFEKNKLHSTAITAPSTIPKAKGITFRDASERTTRIPTSISSLSIKDKGKAKMDELEVPLKKKDQIALDEEMARNIEAQIQAELIEEERLKLFNNEMKRVNTFIPIDSEVMKSKEETEESSKRIEDELDKSKKEESSKKKAEGSRKKSIGKKRAGKEQKQESSQRQKMEDDKETDEHEEADEDDEAEMKKHMEVVQDDEEIAIDVIPLATKPPIIAEYKIVKEGQNGFIT